MGNVADQFLDAMEIMANSKFGELRYDKTILATIYKTVSVDNGEYKVRYNGNIFSAFSEDTAKRYKVDDLVFVKIPEGDFSSRKIITSLVSARSLSYALLLSLLNSIFDVSPDLSEMYGYDVSLEEGIIAGVAPGLPGSEIYIYKGPDSYNPEDYHGLFLQYGSKYENILISAKFLTQFLSPHTKGNYGLEIEFYMKNSGVVSYRLDVSQFNGDPYRLTVYSPQSLVIRVQKNYLLGLKSIRFFEENFVPDKIVENGIITDKENLTVPNLFVKDISLKWVDIKDLSDDTYYLTISAPKGIAFTSSISSIDLVGRLLYLGDDLMDDSTCVCKWFKRDLSVTIGQEAYDKDAGFGWRRIEEAEGKTYTVTSLEVPHSLEYKLIVVYNNEITLMAEIELYNRASLYVFKLVQKTSGDDIVVQIDKESGALNLVGDWYIGYPDGSYKEVESGKRVNFISVTEYLLYSSVIFYCAVYTTDGTYLGALEHSIVSSESSDDVNITYQGEDLFRYDSNGDITIEDSEKERTLLVNLTWKEGYGTSYTVEWLMGGALIGKSKDLATSPPNSMIDNLWVDDYNILHYNIKCKYKVNFNNNTLTVRIRTITEEVYNFEKEILFLKDGDQGTNGTTYVTAIRPCNSGGVKLSGLNPLVYNNGWQGSLNFRCYVYKDGELINNNTSDYTISFKWTGNNVKINGVTQFPYNGTSLVAITGNGTISTSSTSKALEFYVKVVVTITDRRHDNKRIDIYASYPIDVAVGGIDYSLIDITEIPSYIKYTASGVTPQFYSNNLNYLYSGTARNNLITSLNTNLLTIVDRDGGRYLEPAALFLFENKNNTESNIGVLSMRDPTGSTDARRLIHPIIMYLDTYGNEAINGWDGTSIACNDEDGHYIFAPQIGAGKKDNYNRFTGVVMGEDSGLTLSSSETSRRYKVGLFGYQSGVNTFGLLEDGTAFFGAKSGGGLIVINGTNATILGGNGANDPAGMVLTLADRASSTDEKNALKATEAIRIGNGVFTVNYAGHLTATSATITGSIYASSGKIGGSSSTDSNGWTISTNRLYSGNSTNHVELNSDRTLTFAIWAGGNSASLTTEGGYTLLSGAKFAVARDGTLYAREAVIRGTIVASSGTIGGWKITATKLQSQDYSVGMAGSGSLVFWAGDGLDAGTSSGIGTGEQYFSVSRSGVLKCKRAEIDGSITATSGSIGNWSINSNGLYYKGDSTIYLNPNTGFRFNDWFSVNSSGMTVGDPSDPWLKASRTGLVINGKITATSGNIGKWNINENGLYYSQGGSTIKITPEKVDADDRYGGLYMRTSSGSININTGVGILVNGNKFLVGMDGKLKAIDASITGVINAIKGTIGGWGINSLPGADSVDFSTYIPDFVNRINYWMDRGYDSDAASNKASQEMLDKLDSSVNGVLVGGSTGDIIFRTKLYEDCTPGIYLGIGGINNTKNFALFYALTNGKMKTTGGLFGDLYISGSVLKSFSSSRPADGTGYFSLSPGGLDISGGNIQVSGGTINVMVNGFLSPVLTGQDLAAMVRNDGYNIAVYGPRNVYLNTLITTLLAYGFATRATA